MTALTPFSRTEPEHEPAVLDGWEIGRLLDRRPGGASYEVYKSNGDVAALTLRAEVPEDRRERSRLKRMTRLRSGLVHPHLLRVYSTGELGGRPYLITELPPELTMQSLGAPLAPKTCVRMLAEAASALDAAHEGGLVHLTLAADSVLLRSSARHVLLDEFGITSGGSRRERPDLYLAPNYRYAPPEVVRGELPDERSNIYSLACILFEGLTGAAPFDRGHPAWVEAYAHLSEPPPAASERRHDLPAALDDVLAAGLAKEPAERPSSASELVLDVARALQLPPPAALAHLRPALSSGASAPAAAPEPAPEQAPSERPKAPAARPAAERSAPPAKSGSAKPAGSAKKRRSAVDGAGAVAGPARRPAKSAPARRTGKAAPARRTGKAAPAQRTGKAAPARPTGKAAPARRTGKAARRAPLKQRRSGARRLAVPLGVVAVLAAAAATGFAVGGETGSDSPAPAKQPTIMSAPERAERAAALKARQQAIGGLDGTRKSARAALARARTPRGQARAAQRLERAYKAAAARLPQRENARLASALQDTGGAYARLGRAARRGDRAGYRSARRAVGDSEARLQEAIAALRRS